MEARWKTREEGKGLAVWPFWELPEKQEQGYSEQRC